ncbi:MAG: exodeoxyribonuclease VII large subunit [Erysipelotrichaceae bacterium]|nr:exodeoxyribonuclease VII large subunit [Erysipelotrichaceae bacterium]MDY5251876.1 exodeoxyribonuclease VII large subunit [Erysipelotrichaceae bacterium]
MIKVSVLANYLKSRLENDQNLKNIIVQGEISNFTNHKSGHWYFTLKDEQARLSCIMFSTYANKASFLPKDGDKVLIRCNVSLFSASGQMQLYVNAIKLDGVGDLYLKFEQLKNKLAAQGLFASSHKQALPAYPMRIAVVTGKDTAASQDVLTTIQKRWPICEVYLRHVLVQGEMAASQIITALKALDAMNFDIILLVRGGGSIEDLWAFNDEQLAHTIYDLKTCIVSGVGHETDTTICDYVADVRGATPTAAATIATPDIHQVNVQLEQIQNQLKTLVQKQYENYALLLDYRTQQLQKALHKAHQETSRLQYYKQNLILKIHQVTNWHYQLLFKQRQDLIYLAQKHGQFNAHRLAMSDQRLKQASLRQLEQNKKRLLYNIQLLDAYSPLKIMQRGYNLAYKDDELIKSSKQVQKDEMLTLKFSDGLIHTQVKKVENNE